jgi:putative heme-binding domain-containing protein
MFLWHAILLFQQIVPTDIPDTNPHTTPADVAMGKKLYAGRCAGCHGPTGDGGKGANLGQAILPRAADDRSLHTVIRYGIPETEMPSTLLSPQEVWQIAAFVRTLSGVGKESVSGDPHRGSQIFSGKGGCLACHALGARGGHLGPPLNDIATRRSVTHIRRKLTDSAAEIPEGFRAVSLRTRDGRQLSGIRLNEDTYSIQVRDLAGTNSSFWKADLADLRVEKRTLMPEYGSKLTPAEIDDLVAYLSTLRGQQ